MSSYAIFFQGLEIEGTPESTYKEIEIKKKKKEPNRNPRYEN